jgi:hypothetical protein
MRRYRFWQVAFVMLLLAGILSVTQAAKKRLDPDKARELAQQTDDPLQQADYYSDAWLHEEALQSLAVVSIVSAELLWRQARSHIDLGERIQETEKDRALDLYVQASQEAMRAIAMDSTHARAHLMVATAKGRIALFKGPFKAANLVKDVHRHALQAVALNDSLPIALYVLGRTHKSLMEKSGLARTLAGLGFADRDSIAYYFDRALETSRGNMIQCHVEYADYYMAKKTRDLDKAREHLQTALELPVRDEHDPAAKEEARAMLEKLD